MCLLECDDEYKYEVRDTAGNLTYSTTLYRIDDMPTDVDNICQFLMDRTATVASGSYGSTEIDIRDNLITSKKEAQALDIIDHSSYLDINGCYGVVYEGNVVLCVVDSLKVS
jgi:hypothetical protein